MFHDKITPCEDCIDDLKCHICRERDLLIDTFLYNEPDKIIDTFDEY